ncbi:hypothetical protein, partial [Flavobacterium hibisci]|uniref:hypothetical protein n=1 Tax=Flavobacterium hibisci TaxID=1914462 RepID=UPI001CBC0E87
LQRSDFFADQRASRPLVSGTVARGHLKEDAHFFYGRREGPLDGKQAAGIVAAQDTYTAIALHAAGEPYVDTFPFPVTEEVLQRGRERYDIYCSM